MKIHAVLSNKQHHEYGVASIPFPIESDDYEHIIELLEPLEIGNIVGADCFAEELVSDLPVLQILEGQEINMDELDYLAKRLDSFAPYELTQFQAVAAQRGYYKLKDLINLTFCCQEATVVSDFSNLEDIGRKHFLITHDRCTTMGLAKGKLRLVALDLLQNNLSAKITPFSYEFLLLFQTSAPRLLALEGMLFGIIKRFEAKLKCLIRSFLFLNFL